jgi:hypothetical protein
MTTFEDYIRKSVFSREEIDVFLDPQEPTWAQFDHELGYILGNYMPRDGMDGSLTISTTQANGARTSIVYADRPCRINTYGDSFTQCHQVSDQETWQEYLAAHLGEPIRNFGMGGYGVYQSYRRMVRTEKGPDGADYVILYIWGDDHYRSLLRCRHVLTHRVWDSIGGRMLHGNFWSNLEMDLETGELVERGNLLSTRESLYKMTDPDFMVSALKDDWMLQISAFIRGHIDRVDLASVNRLSQLLGCPPITGSRRDQLIQQVSELRDAYAFSATKWIIDRALDFTDSHGKHLLIILFCPQVTRQLIRSEKRYDEVVVDYLRERGIHYFDMNLIHLEDFKCFRLSLDDYMSRYLIGHYSPIGNHFFAFAVKDAIVAWLDPKPVTYRSDEQARVDFTGYLPE